MLRFISFLIVAYSGFMGSLYFVAWQTRLEGMRGGPQDAFRHTFSSAIVAHYAGPIVVDWATMIFERDDTSAMDLMDRHNNAIGKRIGIESKGFREIYNQVSFAVQGGEVNTNTPDRVTWLERQYWSVGL